MKKIVVRNIPANVVNLHAHPLLHNIYAARGVTQTLELDNHLQYLLPFEELKGIDAAVNLLVRALQEDWHVIIVGDFDTDGATSTALAMLSLRAFGLRQLGYIIPNRFTYGYGLTKEIVAEAAQRGAQLIITVDNGISSIQPVELAQSLGVRVLITDHHLPSTTLPAAEAIVNPNQPDDHFASKKLAGVGVIFYLCLALRTALRQLNWFSTKGIPEPNMAQFLDLVALGTVADAVPLDRNNRILVANGISRIKRGKCRLGILALLAVANRSYENFSEYDLGFTIAPRLNAAGRLDDMSLGVEALLTEDPLIARKIASQLNSLNNERREIEAEMQHQALKSLDQLTLTQAIPQGICIFDESWHQGVLGLVSSRLKDRFNRPVIACTISNEVEIKGSARSVDGIHILEVLNHIATQHPGLLSKFGGHAMAAGLSMPRENYPIFAAAFAHTVAQLADANYLQDSIYTDGDLPPLYLTLETAELLHQAGPWGSGFVEPVFHGEFRVLKQDLLGKKHLKLLLSQHGNEELEGIYFNIHNTNHYHQHFLRLKIVYTLSINAYNRKKSLQLLIREIIAYE